MKLLAVDSSTSICSIAINNDGEIIENCEEGARNHSQVILSLIDQSLNQAKLTLPDLDALVFGQGPGSFTGLRLSAAIIQAFSFTHSLKVVPVSSLQAYAQTVFALKHWDNVLMCEDAKIQQVYWTHCKYDKDIMQLMTSENCTVPEDLINYLNEISAKETVALIGTGWNAYPMLTEKLSQNTFKFNKAISIGAGLLQLGQFYLENGQVFDEAVLPRYVQKLQYIPKKS